jgi:uncharacterized protein YqgC (DUF456 family)
VDIFLLILSFLLMIIGILGSFLPVLPGPMTSWVGLLVFHLRSDIEMNWVFLGLTLFVAALIWILDYIIPAMGTKRFGGSRAGMIGTTIGLIVGIVAPIPFGIIIGPFVGAFIGEMINNNNSKVATKAAFGSFLGFLTSTFLKFIVALIYFGLFIMKVIQFKSDIF